MPVSETPASETPASETAASDEAGENGDTDAFPGASASEGANEAVSDSAGAASKVAANDVDPSNAEDTRRANGAASASDATAPDRNFGRRFGNLVLRSEDTAASTNSKN